MLVKTMHLRKVANLIKSNIYFDLFNDYEVYH